MPDRDYYLNPSPRMAEIRARYKEHVAAALKLSGDAGAEAEAKAGRIVELVRDQPLATWREYLAFRTAESASTFLPKVFAEAMVNNEIAAFPKRIDRLDWMSPETKAKAKDELAILKVGVGYPDR